MQSPFQDWPREVLKEEDGKVFANVGFDPLAALRSLQDQWKLDPSTDRLAVVFGDPTQPPLPIQKNFLVNISELFRVWFQGWTPQQLSTCVFPAVHLDKRVSITLFKRLIEISKTGMVELSVEWNLKDLITAACVLRMESVRVRLCDLLRKNPDLHISTVVWMFVSIENHGDADLVARAEKILLKSFEKAIDECSDLLMDFSSEQWISLLGNEELFVLNENKLFSVISAWASRPDNSPSFPEVASHIRIGFLDKMALVEHIENQPVCVREFISALAGSKPAVEALKSAGFPLARPNSIAFKSRTIEVLVQVVRRNGFQRLLAIRPNVALKNTALVHDEVDFADFRSLGKSPDNIVYLERGGNIWAYEPSGDNWKKLTTGRITRKHNMILKTGTYLNGWLCLFFVGRGDRFCRETCCAKTDSKTELTDDLDDYLENEFVVFDLETMLRMDVPCLDHEFRRHEQPVIAGYATFVYIFLTGSYYVYSTEENTWTGPLDLPTTRGRRSACVTSEGMLYLSGIVGNPSFMRKSVRLLCVQDQVVVTGEACGEDSFEVYDDEKDAWAVRKYSPAIQNFGMGAEFPPFVARVSASVFKAKEKDQGVKRPAPAT